MAITLSPDRQTILVASKTIAFGDITASGTAEAAFDVPAGAIVVGGDVTVTEVWDSVTSDNLDVGDGDDPDRYTSSVVDLTAAARTALTLTGYKYAASDTIDVLITNTGGSLTQGSLRLHVWYIVEGRGNEIQS
jgi:hypothetical protein